jgi:arsenate reductase
MKLSAKYIVFILFILLVSCNNQPKEMNTKMKGASIRQNSEVLFSSLMEYTSDFENNFNNLPVERRQELERLASYVRENLQNQNKADLIFICTHKSRRSHMSQIWAQVAATYYGFSGVYCYSGGTEATAFNLNAIRALMKTGIRIIEINNGDNPVYEVSFSENAESLKAFSKKFEHDSNPQKNFAAVMTCSHADETCPLVPGAAFRASITYEDPKISDNTPEQEATYDERCREIGVEMFYLMSRV